MFETRDRQYGYYGDGDDAESVVVVSDVDGGRDVVVAVVAGSNPAVAVFVVGMLPAIAADDDDGYDDGYC